MTDVLDRRCHLLTGWKTGVANRAIASLLGEAPRELRLDRVHFPGRRPVQLNLVATLHSGRVVPVFAEHCPPDAEAHAARVRESLAKSRNGQRSGMTHPSVVADPETGLVFRRPGLDERLPGLRLLHDPRAAAEAIAAVTGRDPGPVEVNLAAHRLGKRAVLRMTSRTGTVYARLRALKSDDGADRLARHRMLWEALDRAPDLRIPEPLGSLPALGMSLFGCLPGTPADFHRGAARSIARAVGALRALDLAGLPAHTGGDEVNLLQDWHARCRAYLPRLADQLADRLKPLFERLMAAERDPVPTHRDLHEKQILISEDVAGILDFDTLSLADPALDPGNLLAHLFLARRDERPLRAAFGGPGVSLWRRAALFRLTMIYAFTSMPEAELLRLSTETCAGDRD